MEEKSTGPALEPKEPTGDSLIDPKPTSEQRELPKETFIEKVQNDTSMKVMFSIALVCMVTLLFSIGNVVNNKMKDNREKQKEQLVKEVVTDFALIAKENGFNEFTLEVEGKTKKEILQGFVTETSNQISNAIWRGIVVKAKQDGKVNVTSINEDQSKEEIVLILESSISSPVPQPEITPDPVVNTEE